MVLQKIGGLLRNADDKFKLAEASSLIEVQLGNLNVRVRELEVALEYLKPDTEAYELTSDSLNKLRNELAGLQRLKFKAEGKRYHSD
ncbi:MAG: hypothetical protein HYS32_01135 [Candidatus Woesearchaeota archaeon]|nr:MAG: hypothetical protein HYS32_01135 [Candidatus Woesearchaeota archaeon]